MGIRQVKIRLSTSFAIVLLLSVCHWFGYGGPHNVRGFGWRGIQALGPAFYLGIILYDLGVWHWSRHARGLGTAAHLLLLGSYGGALLTWPIRCNVMTKADLRLSWSAIQPMYWAAMGAMLLHGILFLIAIKNFLTCTMPQRIETRGGRGPGYCQEGASRGAVKGSQREQGTAHRIKSRRHKKSGTAIMPPRSQYM